MDAGELLGGRYRLAERIGAGGMGAVYRAHDTRLDRPVAVKVLHEGRDVDDVTRARLRVEARLAGTVRHPGVVQVFDYGEDPRPDGVAPFVVMEYVAGTPLSHVLREEGPLSPARTAELVGDVAQALQAAHAAGVVHRDLKPSNILVTPEGRAVLVDFGVARSDTMEPLTETGLIIGSADYLSPEQVQGQRATAASDVFGLGVVAHQCLSATSPFHRDTQAATVLARLHEDAPELPGSVPAPLRRLIASMLARDPADRPTAAEVAERSTTAARPGPVLPPMPPPAAAPAVAPPVRAGWNRQRLLAIAVAAVLLAGTVGLLALQRRDVPTAGASELAVPSVVGLPVDRATRLVRAAGFEVVVEDAQETTRTTGRPGEVVDQSPDPGPYAGTAAQVTLWVVPDVPEPTATATAPAPAPAPQQTDAGPRGKARGHGPTASHGKGHAKPKHAKPPQHGKKRH
ncbi:serine/threonine-protein kinase [Nocardioides sp. T2.26MG-1]|uniref:serine/threonine-protein kinase n=1 Tax=Nocardioides sp. T2.26MG-1 TaxID=3041166 RepID=UPI0025408342|nr:serine/threonine protein kinase [Nocardioides sp. T2.26MG-1]